MWNVHIHTHTHTHTRRYLEQEGLQQDKGMRLIWTIHETYPAPEPGADIRVTWETGDSFAL